MQATASKTRKKRFGIFAAFGAMLSSVKAWLPLALKGTSWIKLSWLFKTGISMIVFLGVYAAAYGWAFAAAIVVLIFIHEMGHWVWIRANGVKAEVPIFIPFVGAVIALKELPFDQATRAWVGYAGPLIGTLGALVFWLVGCATNSGWLMAGGSFGFLLNLFQLVPAKPLDGGWIAGAISRWLLVPGTLFIVFLAFVAHSPLLIIIAIIAVSSLFKKEAPAATPEGPSVPPKTVAQFEADLLSGAPTTTQPATPPPSAPREQPATARQRIAIGAAYVALCCFLGCMQPYCHDVMKEKLKVSDPVKYLRTGGNVK